MNISNYSDDILRHSPRGHTADRTIGQSREMRPLIGARFGHGPISISLLAGCHADEPVGPRLLRTFINFLEHLKEDHHLLSDYSWWIVPHANPDGEVKNRSWHGDDDETYDCQRYLVHVIRELPGDDIEFGFPRNQNDNQARPENRAIFDWWQTADSPFALHVSLHGLAVGAGPWFLVEKEWWPRCAGLRQRCIAKVKEMGYALHDVDRQGEKGFFRLAEGFCSRPDSNAMRAHFIALGDPETASRFRPSSMETMRSFGGDPLTLVSEMPLFIVPRGSYDLSQHQDWKERIHQWRNHPTDKIPQWAQSMPLQPMPIRDQMILQWTLIAAGIEAVENSM